MRLTPYALVLLLLALLSAGCTENTVSEPIQSYSLIAPSGEEIGQIRLARTEDNEIFEHIVGEAEGFRLEHKLTLRPSHVRSDKIINGMKRNAWAHCPAKPVVKYTLRKGLSEEDKGYSPEEFACDGESPGFAVALVDEISVFDNSVGASLLLTERLYSLFGEPFTALNINDGRPVRCNAHFVDEVKISAPNDKTLKGERCFFYTAMIAHNIVFAPSADGRHRIVAMDGLAGSLTAVADGYEVELMPPEPEVPRNVSEEETVFRTADHKRLVGTIALPAKGEVRGGIVIIAGSGPVDRDGNAGPMSSSPYRRIAHFLARHGYASLRYDKRGVGESQPDKYEMATFELLSSDAAEAAKCLHRHERLHNRPIVIAGHSEGGAIAPAVANKFPGIDGVIMLAGNVSNLEQVLKEQLVLIMEAAGATPNEITKFQLQQGIVLGIVKSGVDRVLPSMTTGSLDPDWLRSHFAYEPSQAIREFDGPLLALFFEHDLQVPPAEALVLRKLASENDDGRITVKVLEDLDHMMGVAEPPLGLGQYRNPHRPVSEKMLNTVLEWLDANVAR
ncbi:MAG: alpha/beta fold hydrolase [Planctomycetota bacterium]|nr:alpha/beta fold hydrolase [Planctomycetota bacterium]